MQRSNVTQVDDRSTESSSRCRAREHDRQPVIKLATGVSDFTAVHQPASRHTTTALASSINSSSTAEMTDRGLAKDQSLLWT